MLAAPQTLPVVEIDAANDIDWHAVVAGQCPVIFRGLVKDWPIVQAGKQSAQAAMEYIRQFDHGGAVTCYSGAPEIKGRFFYNDDFTGLNFSGDKRDLAAVFEGIAATLGAPAGPSYYVGSTDVDTYLPGLRDENDLRAAAELWEASTPTVSIWIGNRTTAATHYDYSNNIACCLVGRRRFTLFAPDQIANLYPGPLEPTPGGQVVSLVDIHNPDFERFPAFRQADAVRHVIDLGAGDVLFYPAMWWHQVDALDPFNVMMNYWWNACPDFIDTPATMLLSGMLSLRDRPEQEKQAWRTVFDYYVFGDPERPRAHVPPHLWGGLAPPDAVTARKMRAKLLNLINR